MGQDFLDIQYDESLKIFFGFVTLCPRCLDLFLYSKRMKWIKTSWTYSMTKV